jgi:predicted TIM-barrel fold metal-dependent hydrolase
VHAQRAAVKVKERGVKRDYATLAMELRWSPDVELYENTSRLFYDMERYRVDMCVIMPGMGMEDELNGEIVRKHPDKFIAMCRGTKYWKRVARQEIEWDIKDLCKELDDLFSTGLYKGGIGEGLPMNPRAKKPYTWEERFDEICQMMEVARKHKVPVSYHTGVPTGYGGALFLGVYGRARTDWGNPLFAHDVAAAYPDVPVIMHHGGMEAWWSEMYMDPTFQVAASHPNVYLQCGNYWAELYEKPLRDPNIGAEKLIWGTDWGASVPQQWWPGGYPTTYVDQSRRDGIPAHQVDFFGWSLRQLDKLNIPQDDLNLILGGNAVRLFKLEDKVPHTRLFKQYLK